MHRRWRMLGVYASLFGGCTSSGSGLSAGVPPPDAGPPTGLPDSGPPPESDPPLPDSTTVPGLTPFRRLSVFEYNNTVRDLLGAGAPAFNHERLGYDQGTSGGFRKGASVYEGSDARGLMLSAEEIASAAVQNLATLLPCSSALATRADEDACAEQFITRFGLRTFRRPLEDAEREKLLTLYRRQRGPEIAGSFREAITDLMTALLQTPEFLYHRELAPSGPTRDGQLVRFNGYELASRLSYLFWASMPDEALFTAAAEGKLATSTQLVRQARRLLADGRAREVVQDFHLQLLEVEALEEQPKDPVFQDYTPALARALLDESRAFAASVFFGPQADGKLQSLLTSPAAAVDGPLARYYGVAAPAGSGPQPVSLPAKERAGLFTRGAFLASKADASEDNPIRRSDTILRRLLCQPLPEPSDVVIPPVADVPPNLTTRQRFEVHGMAACAVECHQKIVDPIGYAFEHYDAIGAYRTTDNGQPVNSHATIIFPTERIEFDDAIQLSGILARREGVHDCMSVQWLRYLLGREEQLSGERPTVDALADFYRRSDDLRELMVALVRTRTFTHRSLSPGERAP
jgi:hypothetical protein